MLTALVRPNSISLARLVAAACGAFLALAFSSPAQQPTQPDTAQQPTAPATQAPAAPAAPQVAAPEIAASITEAELKQMLVGKSLYLRDGYLDNLLNFNEYGHLIGHSPQGSYTLNAIQIDRMRITKHKVTLEGALWPALFRPVGIRRYFERF